MLNKALLLNFAFKTSRRLIRYPGLIRWYDSYIRSLTSGRNALEDKVPWVTFSARAWLEKYLKPGMRVCEWGSGGSTIYLAKRVGQITSIEHQDVWFAKVQQILHREGILNCKYILIPHNQAVQTGLHRSIPGGYLSSFPGYENVQFVDYARAIEKVSTTTYDFILIDGRARLSCLFHALPFVSHDGAVMLDNSERPRYEEANLLMNNGWKRLDFTGPGPYLTAIWTTTVWVRQFSSS